MWFTLTSPKFIFCISEICKQIKYEIITVREQPYTMESVEKHFLSSGIHAELQNLQKCLWIQASLHDAC